LRNGLRWRLSNTPAHSYARHESLFLAWQDSGPSRAWFPIGRLDAEISQSRYSFGYTQGATRAASQAGLQPLLAFPDFDETYESSDLFPLFRNRVLGSDRSDFLDYLKQLDLKPEEANPIAILAVTGGTRQTDNLEVFPKLERRADGTFAVGSSCMAPGTFTRLPMSASRP